MLHSYLLIDHSVPRFKQHFQFRSARGRRGFELLDSCLVADYVILCFSAHDSMDVFSNEQFLSILKAQGAPSVIAVLFVRTSFDFPSF